MSGESAFTSIADVLAAARKKSREEAAKLKARALSAGTRAPPPSRTGSTTVPSPAELLDDFDYAIEAVETARKSIAHNPAAVEKAAVTILVAKRRLATGEATDLVKRASGISTADATPSEGACLPFYSAAAPDGFAWLAL